MEGFEGLTEKLEVGGIPETATWSRRKHICSVRPGQDHKPRPPSPSPEPEGETESGTEKGRRDEGRWGKGDGDEKMREDE